MKTIKVQKLTHESFAPYGSFAPMVNPAEHLTERQFGFFPDSVALNIGMPNSIVTFSTCRMKACEHIIKSIECHTYTGEGIMPLDGDCILHFALPNKEFEKAVELIECFYVPKGTMISINPGVWHFAPFAADTESISTLIVLPTRTYANDCIVKHIPEEKWIRFE